MHNPKLLSGVLPEFSLRAFSGNVTLVDDAKDLIEDNRRIKNCRDRDAFYFINKYISNPFYYYQFFRIVAGGNLAYVVGRMDKAKGARALRLVDVFGQPSLLGAALEWFERYLIEKDCEYMDFYYHGADVDVLCDYGFINRNQCAYDVIIPNYFAPYVASSISLSFAYEATFEGPIFKADGDQERPTQKAH